MDFMELQQCSFDSHFSSEFTPLHSTNDRLLIQPQERNSRFHIPQPGSLLLSLYQKQEIY